MDPIMKNLASLNISLSATIGIISAIGFMLFVVMILKILDLNKQQKLQKHRSKEEGLSDLLSYAAVVDDGVIVCKNGSLLAGWLYECGDEESSTDRQIDAVSSRINNAVKGLGSGWLMHVDAVRKPAADYPHPDLSAFPDPVSRAVDEERRELFEGMGTMYEGYYVICLTYFPPMLAEKKFTELMFDDEMESLSSTEQTDQLISYFKQQIKEVESTLGTGIKNLRRLKSVEVTDEHGTQGTHDELLQWLQYCITGLNHPVRLPDNPVYIDSLIGGQEFYPGTIPKMGDKYIQIVAIDGMPMESNASVLSALSDLPVTYRWSNRFIFLDKHESIAMLEKYRKKWRQKIRGFFDQVFNTNSGNINQDAVSMVQDAQDATEEIESDLVAAGYYTGNVILMDSDRTRLENHADYIATTIRELGFGARVETVNTVDAFFGTLPGHGVENIRRPLINTLNFAHFIPTSSIWTGEESHPSPMYPSLSPPLMHCVTKGASPFRLNLHVGDLGHSLMFGPTGAGKSVHLAILALQMRRYEGMQIFSFDKGMSMYATTLAVGGSHYEIASDDSRLNFCPLQFIHTKSDRAWAADWIDSILALNNVQSSPSQRNEIASAIYNMYESESCTLTDFTNTVQDIEIREALKQYTIDGQMGDLLDAEEDSLSFSDFTCFEIEELMNLGDKWALPVLLYLFRRIERSLTGQPAAIFLDEAWIMLGHEVFRDKIREWLKVLRKANCSVIMATQSLSDAERSGILDVIVESTASKIFLPNIYAVEEDARVLYSRMGLNQRQIQIIANAVPKRQYYFVSSQGRRKYELALGPLALAFVGASDKESVATIKALYKKYGSNWVGYWLAHKGLSLTDQKEAA